MTKNYDIPRYSALITHDEDGMGVTLHEDEDGAYQALRQYLADTEVDYQEPLDEDASNEEIHSAAIGRAQFAWEIQEVETP